MSELRLVPAAMTVWLASLIVVLTDTRIFVVAFLLVAPVLAWLIERSQLLPTLCMGICSAFVSTLRRDRAQRTILPDSFYAEVSQRPKEITGGWLTMMRIDDYPAALPVMTPTNPELSVGSTVLVEATIKEIDAAGINHFFVFARNVEIIRQAGGIHRWVEHVHQCFSQAIERVTNSAAQELIPAMVLGDTSGQNAQAKQYYLDTGLAHLSAVSGGNVAIVTSATVAFLMFLGCGPVIRTLGAVSTLGIFVVVVGYEPSVLRALVMGVVGLIAMLSHTRTPPMHALSIVVIAVVLWDSEMAVSFGFALSSAASAGIVCLYPFIYSKLAHYQLPDIVTRMVAVAIAADLVTMPLVSVMVGKISLVSIIANVLVAPVVAPITLVGLAACIVALFSPGIASIFLWVIAPLASWVSLVARVGSQLPFAIIYVPVSIALLIACWVLYAIYVKKIGYLVVIIGVICCGVPRGYVDPEQIKTVVVDTQEEAQKVKDADLIVVRDAQGRAKNHPTIRSDGIPVMFPYRDGQVYLRNDGTQKAADGRF